MNKKNIDWQSLGFAYMDTGSFAKVEFKDGKWHDIEMCNDPNITMHIAATCLHYGQSCFEGLKAFTQKNGDIAIFRPEENAKRMILSAQRLLMKPPPVDLFLKTVHTVINHNLDYVPPYGTGASLYIRPFLIGTSPHVGLHSSEDYQFFVLVMPVGPYYKDGFHPVKAYIQNEYDRAAARGVGHVKAAGNYAAGMKPDMEGKKKGYPICLYLDSVTRSFIDEFGTSNFFAITKDKKFVTPKSSSILASITNDSLQILAEDLGLKVEKRKVPVSELEHFLEVGACGTAAVITPIYSITYNEKKYTYGEKSEAGQTLTKLFTHLQGIQYGEIEDNHEWMIPISK